MNIDTPGSGARVSDVSSSVNIGNDNVANSTFDGSLGETRIYNRVLSQAEISRLYRIGNF